MSNGNVTGGAVGNFVLSADGKTLYLAGQDGVLRIYDTMTNTLVKSVSLGTKLGAIDISPDGSFLLITEQQPVLFNSSNYWTSNTTVSAVYRVDTASGSSSVLTYQSSGSNYTLADVAITASGTAIFSENILPGWSGWVPMVTLNLATGTFTSLGGSYYQAGSLTAAPDDSNVLYGQLNLSSADAYVFSPTGTVLSQTSTYANDVYGYAQGIEAYSGPGGRIAISTGGSVQLWNSSLGYIANLTTAYPQLSSVTGLTFNADGSILFALSSTKDQIYGIRMSDRALVETISLPHYTFSVSAWGDELVLSPDGKTFYLRTTEGIIAAARYHDGRVANDFNGDGRSDVLFQSASTGAITVWQAQANGKFQEVSTLAANALDASWKVAGTGDFNGDGKVDILWRHSSGVIGEWSGQSGQFTNNSGVAANAVDNSWSVVGTSDYNGDGQADILWRHSSGEIGEWTARADGSFINNGGAAANFVDNSWTIVASGDFNGDGKADILWRHTSGAFAEWQGSSSGRLINVGSVLANANGSFVGTGDFDGDGRTDVLLRNPQTGLMTLFMGQSSGQFSGSVPGLQVNDLNWKIVGIGDYNGDGKADLIWQHSTGASVEWLSNGSGSFINNGSLPAMPGGFAIVASDIWLV